MPGNSNDNTPNSVVVQAIVDFRKAIENHEYKKIETCLKSKYQDLPVAVLRAEVKLAQQRLKILDEEVSKQLESKHRIDHDLNNLSCPKYHATIRIVILLEDYIEIKEAEAKKAALNNPSVPSNTQATATPVCKMN